MKNLVFDYSNKNILIVGGSSGIGYQAACLFSSHGGKVIVTCKSKKSLEAFEDKNQNKNITIELLDLTNEISIEKLEKKIESLDILVNCATLIKGGIEYRIENFSDVVNVNLMGTLRICHSMLPKLALKHGNIINLSSINTKLANAKSPGYSATKAGIETLTKSMAACWAVHNIRVNCIAPGWVEGNTSKILVEQISDDDESYLSRIPMSRLGKQSEVAYVILFLSSQFASYMTGTTILVDGGFSIN